MRQIPPNFFSSQLTEINLHFQNKKYFMNKSFNETWYTLT